MLESVLGPDTLAGLGMDGFRFAVPVRPGDTLRARVTVTERRGTKDAGRGVVSVGVEVMNQRGECALAYRTTVLMRR
jgi:acyl dehydratase